MISSRRFKWSLLLGNLLEHYDNALFSLLSPFFALYFFPEKDYLTALILVYAILPIGMMARPIGSLFFGSIGDTKGRHYALFWSLLGMAIITASMGLIPSYTTIGIAAPILLAIGKIGQNFFAAGETIGGGVYLLENSPKKEHAMLSSFYSAFTVGGILLGSLAVSFLYAFDWIEDYWRILFLIGGGTALSAWVLRSNHAVYEPPLSKPDKRPFLAAIKTCWKFREPLLIIILVSGFSYASFSIASLVMNGFIPMVSENTHVDMVHLNSALLIINMLILPLFGWLTRKYSNERMMIIAAASSLVITIPLLSMAEGCSLAGAFFIRLCFVVIGVCFSAPFYAWAQNIVPSEHRYTITSVGYAIGAQVFGGPTASLSLWIFKTTGSITAAGWYWMCLGLAATLAILKESWKSYSFIDENKDPLPAYQRIE